MSNLLFQGVPQLPGQPGGHRLVAQVDHGGELLRGKLVQGNGIPVGLLYRGTVVAPGDDAGILLPEQLASKPGAFDGELVRVELGKDPAADLVADGPGAKGLTFLGLGLLQAIGLDLRNIRTNRPFSRLISRSIP